MTESRFDGYDADEVRAVLSAAIAWRAGFGLHTTSPARGEQIYNLNLAIDELQRGARRGEAITALHRARIEASQLGEDESPWQALARVRNEIKHAIAVLEGEV